MPSWESLIRIAPSNGWGSVGTIARQGMYLYADSENLDFGAVVTENDKKLTGMRESAVETFGVDRWEPKGGIVFQPRVDDILPILMAHFQNVVKSGVGTYTFFRNPNPVQYVTSGNDYCVGTVIGSMGTAGTGRSVYSVDIDLFFGNSFINTAVGSQCNGIRYNNAIVDKLTLGMKYGEDVLCTPEFKIYNGDYFAYPSDFNSVPGKYGSFSQNTRLVDYHGTVVIAGESFSIDSWQGNFNNNTSDKKSLGYAGISAFPMAGRYTVDGSFDMELQRDLAVLAEGLFGSLNVNIFASASNRIQIVSPNIAYRAFNIQLSGGQDVIELSRPYRAYPPSGTTGPSTQVTVYTGTTYATSLYGF